MHYSKVAQISIAGMMAQKARIEAAALNLSNMNTSIAPGSVGFRPVTALIHLAQVPFSAALKQGSMSLMLARAELVPQNGVTTRAAYEPGNPDADSAGMVLYPAIDQTHEMMTVMTALRAYEANLAVLESAKALSNKALEIGAQ